MYGMVISYRRSVACHPEAVSLLAAGLFTGEVRVWDLSASEDTLLAQYVRCTCVMYCM